MLKNFKKKSLKAKIGIIAFILFMILLVGYVLYSNFKPEPPAEYELASASYGTVIDTLDVNGTVESGLTREYTAIEGVVPQEVLVHVGDKVEKGDLLATFDVSGAAKYISQADKEYKKALADYNSAKSSADSTAKKKSELNTQITSVKAKIAAAEKEAAALEEQVKNTSPTTENVPLPQEQIAAIAAQMAQNGATEEQINSFISAAGQVTVPSVSDNGLVEQQQKLMKKQLELAQLNSQLASLQAENTLTVSTGNDSVLEALKTAADAKKQRLDNIKAVYDKMKNGWYAESTGIVTSVELTVGSAFVPSEEKSGSAFDLSALMGAQSIDSSASEIISSLMGNSSAVPSSAGIVVESYEDMIVTVSVGKADLLKVSKGMEATVISLDKEYEGEVIYVGATAAQSDELNLGAITSSIMGGSSSGGAIIKVKIKNPDKNVVIGFDVDIKIKLNTVDNVLKIPVESVIYNNGTYSVYVYNEENSTVTKRAVTKGTLDDTSYEITDGLKEGERVVKSPDPNMADGTKIKEKTA